MVHLRAIAQRPRPPGSAEHARVRAYIVRELEALGFEVQLQEATVFSRGGGMAARVRNVVARRGGTDPGGRALLLAAHYDGVGAGPAASDDGAGVVALLETSRAVSAGPPLRHDLLLLITDAEEVGLLGAALFVADHPWAADVGAILNFEARGTHGRSYMFESSPGNGELVAALAAYGDAAASSLWTPIYRSLPNDTDLSRLMELGVPALNFAYVDGLERYHSSEDDTVHIDSRSVQHHGEQALFLTRRFGNSLPAATRRDAVFFALPLVGLVRYPEALNPWLAAGLCLLLGAAAYRVARGEQRWLRDGLLGLATTFAAAIGGALASVPFLLVAPAGVGTPGWRALYAAALALGGMAVAAGFWILLRRRASAAGAQLGVAAAWALIALLTVRYAAGASFLFLWPAMAATAALWVSSGGDSPRADRLAGGISAVVSLVLLVPALYLVAVVGLGVLEPGGMLIGLMVPLMAVLLAPQLEGWIGWGGGRLPLACLGLAIAIVLVCAVVPRPPASNPIKSALVAAVDGDAGRGWLASARFLAGDGSWATQAMAAAAAGGGEPDALDGGEMEWVRRAVGYPAKGVPIAPFPAPEVVVERVAERETAAGRQVTLRVIPPPETLMFGFRVTGARVRSVAVDGIDQPYWPEARPGMGWGLSYAAPPPEGVLLDISLVEGAAPPRLEVTARLAGLPGRLASTLSPRPPGVVVGLTGDITVVRRRFPL